LPEPAEAPPDDAPVLPVDPVEPAAPGADEVLLAPDEVVVELELVGVVVVVVALATLGGLPAGTVSGGAPLVSVAGADEPPQAEMATAAATQAATKATQRTRSKPTIADLQDPSGSIRLPQTGQSLRSFWAS
jgi:hypothetical protein